MITRELHVLSELLRREVRLQYRGTALGLVWAVASPLAVAAVYVGLFGGMFGAAGDAGYARAVLAALIPWTGFAAALCAAAHAPLTHAALLRGHRVQVRTLATAAALAALPALLIGLALMLAAAPATLMAPGAMIALPGLLALLTGLAIAGGWLLALANLMLRDTQHALQYALRLAFWVTPVLWTTAQLPPRLAPFAWLVQLNPMSGIASGFRAVLAGATAPSVVSLAPALLWTCALAMTAAVAERHLGRRVAELV